MLSEPKPGDTAVVIGAGPIGLAAAICLREQGVEDIVVVNRSRSRLQLAAGLDTVKPFETVSTLDDDWLEQLEKRFGTTRTQSGSAIDVDIWIDAASSAEVLQSVYNKARRLPWLPLFMKPLRWQEISPLPRFRGTS